LPARMIRIRVGGTALEKARLNRETILAGKRGPRGEGLGFNVTDIVSAAVGR
jgi:hypothetical protein